MEMEKKNLAIILLAVVLAASGVGNIFLGVQLGLIEVVPPARGQDLVYGTFQGDIVHLDPHYAYDSASIDVINQVCETLYRFNTSDPNLTEVPHLAADYPSVTPDGLEWTIDIQTGIRFHDNTTLDATAVKWNFDRLQWFFNYSGNAGLPPPFNESLPDALPSGIPTPSQLFGSVYMNPDGSPLVNRTEVVDADTVRFYLNAPRGAFFSLLAFTGCAIMSPTSTPANDYVQLHEQLIGTGPFRFMGWAAGVEIRLAAFDDYWQGRAQLDTITIVILASNAVLNQALLSGDIDILTAMDPAFIDQFATDPDIHLEYAGNTLTVAWVSFKYPGAPGSGHHSLAMRKATAYCLNYTHIIDVVYDRIAVRWPTYIPLGIAYANYTLDYPTFNRTRARLELLNDPYYSGELGARGLDMADLYDDAAWTAVADGGNPLEHYNYSWNIGNDQRHYTGDRLAFDLRYLGVDCDVNGMAWGDLVTMLTTDRAHLGLFMMGWRPDYIDPENYISAIWHPTASTNAGEYYEADVVALMDAGVLETDPVARKAIYDEIQQKMVERDFPGLHLTAGLNYDAWYNYVHGFVSNPLADIWWYDVYMA
ncbi:MAG: ABC transporter substrate-binding protein [Candidatus Hodarchaeota archaeon]